MIFSVLARSLFEGYLKIHIYYINTSEIPGFFLLLGIHIFIARSEDIREVKHDVNGRRQPAKITFDFEFFSSNP